MKRWSIWATVAVALALPSLLAIGAADAATKSTSQPAGATAQGPNTTRIPKAANRQPKGQAAIDKLGTRMDAVARKHGKSAAQLSAQLLADETLFVDDTDELLFVEPPLEPAATTPSPLDPTIPTASAFLLHSKPGANRVIYLDFDGHSLTNTAWNNYTGGNNCEAGAYDMDGAPGTFSDAERNEIVSVWKRVSEDYAPFDIDVTTQDPGYDAINRASISDTVYGTRAVVTKHTPCVSSGSAMAATSLYASVCAGGCGGVAFVGVYDGIGAEHDYYQPALIFQDGVGWEAKYVAEAVSHEVGHNVGLSHDGTATVGYYSGHGNWAPIMGVGYYEALAQWSKGEYAGANNTEDDFAVAISNGLTLRSDDHGDTVATATTLAAPNATTNGIISTRTDVDAFTIAVGAGAATFTATPAPTSPDLDLKLELRNSSGAVVAANDPASGSTSGDAATGLGATISATLAAGTYTVLVDGVGYGDPLSTGYTDYGSVGFYRLTVAATAPPNLAPVAVIGATPVSGTAPLTVAFTGSGSTDPENGTLTYSWNFGDNTTSTVANPSHTYSAGTYTARLTVTDPAGNTGNTTTTITVTPNLTPTAVIGATPTSGTAALTVAFTGSGSTDPENGTLTYSWNFGDNTTSTVANPSKTYSTAGTYTATLTVRDPVGNTATATKAISVTAPVRSAVDVAALGLLMAKSSATRASGTASVIVRDNLGANVGGVAVTATWTVGTKLVSTKTVTTGTTGTALGVANFSSGNLTIATGTVVKFCVTKLAFSGIAWNTSLSAPTTATDCKTWTA